jgi:hypothetical protein
MATNHVIASARLESRDARAPKTGYGLIAIAFLLAIVLGLGAVDVQRERALEAAAADPVSSTLDGRGKWGGYLP